MSKVHLYVRVHVHTVCCTCVCHNFRDWDTCIILYTYGIQCACNLHCTYVPYSVSTTYVQQDLQHFRNRTFIFHLFIVKTVVTCTQILFRFPNSVFHWTCWKKMNFVYNKSTLCLPDNHAVWFQLIKFLHRPLRTNLVLIYPPPKFVEQNVAVVSGHVKHPTTYMYFLRCQSPKHCLGTDVTQYTCHNLFHFFTILR